MNLFEDVTARGIEPVGGAKPGLHHLDRSAMPRCAQIRDLLDECCQHLPPESQSALRFRFRTADDRQYLRAFFELYLLELLSKLGFGIELHPQREKKAAWPDIEVLKDGSPLMYLETTLAVSSAGAPNGELGRSAPHVRIRKSILETVCEYEQLDLPYVIAIDVIDELGVDDIDISNALLGEEQSTVVFCDNNFIRRRPGRKPNGVWRGPRGPQNRRVSAALFAANVSPGNFTKVIPRLWHNPWARRPLTQDIWPLPQLVPE